MAFSHTVSKRKAEFGKVTVSSLSLKILRKWKPMVERSSPTHGKFLDWLSDRGVHRYYVCFNSRLATVLWSEWIIQGFDCGSPLCKLHDDPDKIQLALVFCLVVAIQNFAGRGLLKLAVIIFESSHGWEIE